MLGCSLFGTGSTAYYVLVIGLLSTLPYSCLLYTSFDLGQHTLKAGTVVVRAGVAIIHKERCV